MPQHDGKDETAAGIELAAALRYAGGGVNVFPVNGRKVPLTGNGGFKHATRDREQIERWWRHFPHAGIATADFDVVDVDLYKPECAGTWKRIKPLIPAGTPQSKTGGGGLQFFFKAGTLRDGKIGPGVDNRYACRNYVLLPPSLHKSGNRYEVVVDLLLRRPKPAPDFPHAGGDKSEFRQLLEQMDDGEKISDGRNKAAWWRAVEAIQTFPGPVDVRAVETLIQSWVNENCAGDLDEVDVAKQVRGAVRFVEKERREKTATWSTTTASLTWRRLSEFEMRSIVFVDKPLLQADAFHLVAGRKGQGKGTLLASWASSCTRGELGDKRNVVWIGSEDSNAIDVKPRILASGGDPERILVVGEGWIQLPRDFEQIREAIETLGEVGILIIDPVGNHITGKNSNADTDIRDAIAPLNKIADEYGCLAFGVRHLSEKDCSRGVLAAILGASAWVHVPRAVLAVAKDNDDPNVSHIQCVAGNRLPPETPGRMFRIEGVLLPGLENEVTKAVWLGDSSKDVESMLAQNKTSKSGNARELILDILEGEGEQESDALDARVAREAGIAAKTVRNLRTELKDEGLIKSFPEKTESGTVDHWVVSRTQAPRT
jgi:bifunctional DNA primase/polymerase-like protein/AAA domain-containing protein